MMKQNKLTAKEVEHLTQAGRHPIGDGLYLNITNTGTKSWLFRYQLNGNRRWAGLGSYCAKSNTLAMARRKTAEMKLLIHDNLDPIDAKRSAQESYTRAATLAKEEDSLKAMTFKRCALDYIAVMEPQWSNPKHRLQWRSTLADYAYPHIGTMPVSNIEIEHIRQCLDPIWHDKTETAKRLRQRIESVIGYAIVHKHRDRSNPAVWKGLLDKIYPSPERIKAAKHIENGTDGHLNALPYTDLPSFITELRKMDGVAALALRFTILTASRTKPIRCAEWDEFDLKKKEWRVPAAHMKGSKPFRVALSDEAIQLIEELPRFGKYVFPGGKMDKPMSENAMLAVLQRMGRNDVTVHGFRSTFRDYIGEETGYPYRVAEFALAHGISDATEKAYARGDMLQKRFKMMNDWAVFCNSEV